MTTSSARPRRRGSGRGSDRGSATLQIALLFPVILTVIYALIQGAMYFHARNVASSAAQEGLRDARAENSTAAAGISTARAFIRQSGGTDVLTGANVTGHRTETEATITVTGRSIAIVPGLFDISVKQSASGAVERYTAPGS